MKLPETQDPTSAWRRWWERRRRPALRIVAVGVTTAVGGAALVPVLDVPAAHAHSHTELCSELVGQAEEYIYEDFPAEGSPPVEADGEDYTYEAEVDEILGTLEEPTREYLDQATEEWANEPVGSEKNLAWSYKTHLAGNPDSRMSWDQWSGMYVGIAREQARGLAYERTTLSSAIPLDTPDWLCRDVDLRNGRTTSAVNRITRQFINVTPGSTLSQARLNSYRDLTNAGYRAHHVFGSNPSAALQQQLRNARTTWSVQHSNGIQTNRTPPPPPPGGGGGRPGGGGPFNPPCRPYPKCWQPAGGAVNSMARNSGTTAREAVNMRNASNQVLGNTPRGFRPPFQLGGIDWTSLELRYVSDDPGSNEFDYAFSADDLPEGADPSFGGEAVLDLSSDALFTWLALEPSQFWVNLNPDQPDKIIDEQFATTEAGRVLLESDFELKSTLYAHMDPGTESGADFFESLEAGPNGELCWASWRMWVEPLPASVREDGDQLYILDAPLRVQMEPFEVSAPPGSPTCEEAVGEEIAGANLERLVESMTPLVEEAVNTAPEYADLRRVFTSRIAAEWLRQRDAVRPGVFHDIIGSGDVTSWPVRDDWDPQDVYDEFLEARETVQFRYEYEHGGQDYYMDVTGGIAFPDAPRDPMPEAQFEQEHPTLPKTVEGAKYEAVADRDAETEPGERTAWLGGGTLPDPVPDTPDPSPTPTEGGDGPGDKDPGDGEPTPDADGFDPENPPVLAATGFSDTWPGWTALGLLLTGLALMAVRAGLQARRD